MNDEAVQAKTIDLLRRINPEAWATIEEPNGWTYGTNIGHLAHQAADEISVLQLENIKGASALSDLEKLRKNFAEFLVGQYRIDPNYIAKLCDEQLDKSGALLGYVRDAANALDNNYTENEPMV